MSEECGFGHGELDRCPGCGGCVECGTCYCEELEPDFEFDDEFDGMAG